MIFKNISKTKLSLALISLVITFFVWQQGFRDSLSRPSVSFDITQKEQEIAELAARAIPTNLKNFFITNDPVDQIILELVYKIRCHFSLKLNFLDLFSI